MSEVKLDLFAESHTTMSSIEDILNAEDSDDDINLSDSVDLEYLLHSKDDFDDNAEPSHRQRDIHENELEAHNVPSFNLDVDSTCGKNNVCMQPGIPVEELGNDLESVDEGHNEDSDVDRLNQAEVRERRFLDSGQKDVISALQSKRTSNVLVNYSNVRCDELSTLSNQLKRNSSYMQHGPGAATSMVVDEAYIAVGTSKGLVILFDHQQEIRSVLGSNLTITSRPTSAVTALDTHRLVSPHQVKGFEGLLVSGYSTGEIALWDVAKGIILKLIADLHSSAIITASILDSTSDGLTSIGGSGDEANFVGLPAGWHPISTAHHDVNSVASVRGISTSIASVAASSMQSTSLIVISADGEGVMYKTRFSKTMWSSAFASESECLLDSSTGPLSGYAPLPPLLRSIQSNNAYLFKNRTNSADAKACCRYVAAHRTARLLAINVGNSQTWIVQTHPKIKILYKWDAPKPETACLNISDKAAQSACSSSSRCLDWTWVAQKQEGSAPDQNPIYIPADQSDRADPKEGVDWIPVLARCWGEGVELLSALTTEETLSEPMGPTVANVSAVASPTSQDSAVQSITSAFSFLGSTAAPVSAASLSSRAASEKCVFLTKFSTSHRCSFVGQRILSLRWVSSTELVLLTTSDVIVTNQMLETMERFSLQPSLSMELNSFFATAAVVPAPSTIRLQNNVSGRKLFVAVNETMFSIQMQSCFELANRLTEKGQWLEALALVLENVRRSPHMLQLYGAEVDRYIIRYAELAVKHPGTGSAALVPNSAAASAVNSAQSKNHFHLVSGVCIEYCIACSHLELLFSHVYNIFKSVQRHYVFLEALEPYVLSQNITSLPPTLIAEFCESALRFNRLPSIERCVPYFEIAHLDMNFITKFLYENRMFSSFLYVYAHGLNDFAGAFQIIFNFMLLPRGSADQAQDEPSDFADVGYKLLLFLCYTFDGRVFPRGDFMSGPHGDASWQLLQLAATAKLCPTPSIFSLQSAAELQAIAGALGPYPYLRKLYEVDKLAMLHALRKGIILAEDVANLTDESPPSQSLLLPAAIKVGLSSVFDNLLSFCVLVDQESSLLGIIGDMESLFFKQFFDLIVESECSLLMTFLNRFVMFCSSPQQERAVCEAKLLSLATNQHRANHAHCSEFTALLNHHNFGLASLLASQATVSTEQFRRCLAFYVKEGTDHADMKRFAFEYIHEALRSAPVALGRVEYQLGLIAEVLRVIVPLCYLDLLECRRLVQLYLSRRVFGIMENSAQDLKMQFALLNALIPSQSDGMPGERGRELIASFDEKAVVVYFNLLATYDPANVLEFLKSFEHYYPLDDCLQICRQKGISESVAFLMERTGDVLDALLMLLRDFSLKLKQVRRDVDAQLRSEMAAQAAAAKANLRVGVVEGDHYLVSQILAKQDVERAEAAKKLPSFKLLESLISCVADLCSRNSGANQTGMWLTAFDHLLMERRKFTFFKFRVI